MHASHRVSRREFVGVAAAAAGASLLPGELWASPAQAVQGRSKGRERVNWSVEPFPLSQVRLLAGPFQQEQETNRRWLHSLPSDRLLHTFRLTAGLASSAQPLGGWEKPDCELRGHFAGGHYLSACALAYASTGDDELKKKADGMVAELAKCQTRQKNGYLSAFPEELFDRLRNGQNVWAPYYTIHKIMAGHLDMYTYCGNEQALAIAEGMAGWVRHWVQPLSDEHMARVLGVEHGGMLEVLCNLYAVTGKEEYLYTARRFDHRQVFDPLAEYRDELKGLHANTNIPKITGAARQYELTGDRRYRNISNYFWDEVVARRTYCTGGTSNEEHWEAEPGRLAKELGQNMEECCCGYNMLKLARHIFGWTADPRAMDYYERTLFNSRLGTQDADGMKSYFLPLAPGYWKYYNSAYDSFWCCTGTGAEEFAQFGNTVYFHDDNGIYVNLFVPSEANWPEKEIRLRQETNFPEQEATSLIVRAARPVQMSLNVRVPCWATRGVAIKLNGQELPVSSSPSSYLELRRVWKDGDRVEVALPMSLHVDPLLGDESWQAAMYGPLVLAGRLGAEGLTESMTRIGYDTTPGGKPGPAPVIRAHASDAFDWVEAVAGQRLSFRTAGQTESISLVPLYKVSGERYAVYWKVQL
jgi:DUF1680 family protein